MLLIDKQGHVVEFEAYGIERIASDIESVKINDIVHLFKNVTKGEIERLSGPVDILIGYEYAAYHPEREQNIGHLVLLRNRFERCIGGTHPLLKESHLSHDFINARVNTIVGKMRIVFNSSANYMGHILNEYWAKCPDLLNNL